MNRVLFTAEFKRKAKPLSKKYHTLKDNIDNLGLRLVENPFSGESYGSNLYKIRLADESKGKGKSGGFRVMYYLAIQNKDTIDILLITIFDKAEADTIKKKDAESLLQKVLAELKALKK
jgi:mRNA-degrading endonuclease RelE of RelBE toxin-antitoxin system